MKNRSKKKVVIRTKPMTATERQVIPMLHGKILEVKPPVVNSGIAHPAAQFVDHVRGKPERPPGVHIATSRPDFSPQTLAKSLVDVVAYEGLMVFRFQGD